MDNGDMLRNMSNEQLAMFLANERYRLAKPVFEAAGFGITFDVVYAKLLQWINEEAENG